MPDGPNPAPARSPESGNAAAQPGCARAIHAREGLGDVIVGTEFQPHYPIRFFIFAREQHDGHVTAFAQLACELHAVFARQFQVQQHQIDRFAFHEFLHGFAAGYTGNAQFVVGKVFVEQVADAGIIIDDEDVRIVIEDIGATRRVTHRRIVTFKHRYMAPLHHNSSACYPKGYLCVAGPVLFVSSNW